MSDGSKGGMYFWGPLFDQSIYDDFRDNIFIPENPSVCKLIQNMFNENESADVVFEVGGHDATNDAKNKRIKTTKTELYAHHLILSKTG